MDRFFANVEKTDSCWIWKGAIRNEDGYGAIKVDGKTISVHRYSYEKHKGEIPKGMLVSHRCHNKLCVNPDHLITVTPKENYDMAVKRGTIIPPKNEHLKKHPSRSAYKNGCRCSGCTELQKLAQRRYRSGSK
jgi:hypothetical protein